MEPGLSNGSKLCWWHMFLLSFYVFTKCRRIMFTKLTSCILYGRNIVYYLLLKDTIEIKRNETVYWFLEIRNSLQYAALCITWQLNNNYYFSHTAGSHVKSCRLHPLAVTSDLQIGVRVGNGGHNKNNCPPHRSRDLYPGPSGVWEKHFSLISFHSASEKLLFKLRT